MIDLTNFEHKRGIMILTSKDVRVVDRSMFGYHTNAECIKTYAIMIEDLIQRNEFSGDDKKTMMHYLKTIQEWCDEADQNVDKLREVFR